MERRKDPEIKEGRVTSRVAHQRETAKRGDKPFLVETEPLQSKQCKVLTVMQTMEGWEKQTWSTPATPV